MEVPGNEGAHGNAVAGVVVGGAYKAAIRAVDGSRPVTGNSHNNGKVNGTILDVYDVIGGCGAAAMEHQSH